MKKVILPQLSLTILLLSLVACSNDEPQTTLDLNTYPSDRPKRQVLFDCIDPPENAVVNEMLDEEQSEIFSINCRKGLGHILSGISEYLWIYREDDYAGIKVPITAALNAKMATELEGEDFHEFYFTEISLTTLDEDERSELFKVLREHNTQRIINDREIVKKISAVNQSGVAQHVYLMSNPDTDKMGITNPEIGFVCNPDCQYSDIFYKRFWPNMAKKTIELRKKYGKDKE